MGLIILITHLVLFSIIIISGRKNAVITTSFVSLLWQNVSFTSPFYSPPVILASVLNGGSNNTKIACPVKGPLGSWLEVNPAFTSYYR